MPHYDDDSWDDSWDDGYDDDMDDDDAYNDDDEPTVACPHCRAEIHEDSQRCPVCGEYISTEDAPYQPKPVWIVIGVAVCLLLVYLWTVGAN
jgi:hypothetical protein